MDQEKLMEFIIQEAESYFSEYPRGIVYSQFKKRINNRLLFDFLI